MITGAGVAVTTDPEAVLTVDACPKANAGLSAEILR
jgi:hypothetical protein